MFQFFVGTYTPSVVVTVDYVHLQDVVLAVPVLNSANAGVPKLASCSIGVPYLKNCYMETAGD